MKKTLILGLTIFTVLLASCGDEAQKENTENSKEKAAIEAFDKAVEDYNQTVDDYCACLELEMDEYTCSKKHSLNFSPTKEMEAVPDDYYNLSHVHEGKEKIDAKKKELGL